jgi:hypothetical protein
MFATAAQAFDWGRALPTSESGPNESVRASEPGALPVTTLFIGASKLRSGPGFTSLAFTMTAFRSVSFDRTSQVAVTGVLFVGRRLLEIWHPT